MCVYVCVCVCESISGCTNKINDASSVVHPSIHVNQSITQSKETNRTGLVAFDRPRLVAPALVAPGEALERPRHLQIALGEALPRELGGLFEGGLYVAMVCGVWCVVGMEECVAGSGRDGVSCWMLLLELRRTGL